LESYTLVADALSKSEYLPFLRYCKENSILFVEQVTFVDYVNFKELYGCSSDEMSSIKSCIAGIITQKEAISKKHTTALGESVHYSKLESFIDAYSSDGVPDTVYNHNVKHDDSLTANETVDIYGLSWLVDA